MRIVGLLLSPLLASTLLASTASGSRQHAHVAVNPAAVLATPWAYVGNAAPDYWAELDNDYALCGVEGDEQSPINLDVPPKDLEFKVPDPEDNHVAMEFNYSDAPVEMLYDGHTVRWNVRKETQSTVVADGRTYELRYVEVHTPGEHRVRDIRFPLELQFVHYEIEDPDAPKSSKDAAVLEVEKEEEAAVARGQMMIVSVLATEGKENGPVMKMQAALPERANVLQAGKQNMTINADDLLPQRKSYYYYEGSITRPPCVEDVRWYVMTDFIQVSRSQIAAFEDLTGETARPVQGQGYTAAQRKGIEEEASDFDKDAKMPVGAARRRTVDVYTGPDFGVEFHEGQPIPDGRYKPGPTGRRGEQGDRGERGPKGPEGPRGRRGVKGKDGIPGEVGVKGVPGELGDGGDYGLPGLTGNQGAPGPKGPKGPKGPAGKDGKDGEVVRGPKGPVGPSGENLKGDKGDKGPRGPKGPKGPRGPIGQTGPQGIMGDVDPNGPRGPTGPIGDRGQIGRQGPAGPQGVRGKDGAPGPRGERGPQGDRGPMGPAGKELPFTNTNIFAQELAEAVCMSSMTGNVKTGYVYAVMRDCGEKTTCDTICRKYASDPLVPHLSCHNALHVYSNLPAAGIKKRGLKVHKYQAAGCQATYCGPNFCCCSSLEKR